MNNKIQTVKVAVRLKNVIFRCVLCDKWYNAKITQAFGVNRVAAILPHQGSQALPPGAISYDVGLDTAIICETCFKVRKDLDFEDNTPKITVAQFMPPKRLSPNDIRDIKKRLEKN